MVPQGQDPNSPVDHPADPPALPALEKNHPVDPPEDPAVPRKHSADPPAALAEAGKHPGWWAW